jgi:hypothetical protein
MTQEEYVKLVSDTYSLIVNDIDGMKDQQDLAVVYPKFITMYEFFRLLRGEAFTGHRPHTPQQQKDFYRMENEIAARLETVRNKLDPSDERVTYYLSEAKKSYT